MMRVTSPTAWYAPCDGSQSSSLNAAVSSVHRAPAPGAGGIRRPVSRTARLAAWRVARRYTSPGSRVNMRVPCTNLDHPMLGSSTTWSTPYAVVSSQPLDATSTSASRYRCRNGSRNTIVSGSMTSVWNPSCSNLAVVRHLASVTHSVAASSGCQYATPSCSASATEAASIATSSTLLRASASCSERSSSRSDACELACPTVSSTSCRRATRCAARHSAASAPGTSSQSAPHEPSPPST
mmetsp:Transcript_39509/g.86041  ORF Transcript_39509/g.86041 Transcript_39509/m.86041 type:complete len:239 (-) Transcript_39509:13-729(-)